jgi:hypothetical protein
MSSNDQKTGYSNALGGFGVPTQVQETAASSAAAKPKAASAKPRKKSKLVFKPKPRNLLFLGIVAAVIVVVILLLTGVIGGRYASSITTIEKQTQLTNGAQTTNYLPILASDVDWANISSGKREGIAKYAVEASLKEVEKDQANIYNIMGMTTEPRTAAFIYSVPEKTIQIIVDGKVVEKVPLG